MKKTARVAGRFMHLGKNRDEVFISCASEEVSLEFEGGTALVGAANRDDVLAKFPKHRAVE